MKTQTYQFRTFQELFDRVPTDRIRDCMDELAQLFVQTKATAEMGIELAKIKGISLDGIVGCGITVPDVIEWVDDGKGEISGTMVNAETGAEVLNITTRPKDRAEVQP